MPHPSASFSAIARIRLDDHPGGFARLAAAIAAAGGSLGAIDLVRVERGTKIRDVSVLAADARHLESIVDAMRAVEGMEVLHVSDRTFLMHLGGKIEVVPKVPVKTHTTVFPLAQANEALYALRSGKLEGAAVLVP